MLFHVLSFQKNKTLKQSQFSFNSILSYILWVCLNITYFVENWKHCNKIIFKCVNSTIRPSFKVFFLKKYFRVPWIVYGTHWKNIILHLKTWNALLKKKKKNMKHNHKCFSALSKKILQRKREESREISDQYSTSIANSLAMHGKILHKFSNIILCLF